MTNPPRVKRKQFKRSVLYAHTQTPQKQATGGNEAALKRKRDHEGDKTERQPVKKRLFQDSAADSIQMFKERLLGGKFRWINSEMYSNSSQDVKKMFAGDKSLYDIYQLGYKEQVKHWPADPLDVIIEHLKSFPTGIPSEERVGVLPKSKVIADLGCGAAKLAREMSGNTVHSFDLVAINDSVTVCDIAGDIPLKDNSCDVVVVCLAMMVTNFVNIVKNARRILKPGGLFKVAEVTSRLVGGADAFQNFITSGGFEHQKTTSPNKYFMVFDFLRTGKQVKGQWPPASFKPRKVLKASLYKTR
eukprot:TRINITY_DN56687_c0_g1_i1.p1 TRINITY_DN56687_c0_g1~~TRINITY_DN56687_c0_g1_i1.p1  ORF type:complete len:302 (-),score=12.67 TRINITY_DN56687_c0_g1_i1:376-1281(-)